VIAEGMIGHEGIRRILDAELAQKRLPHALLFSGPEGVGKRTLALALARAVVTQGDAAEAKRFDRGAHDRFVLYEDLDRAVPMRRRDLLVDGLGETELLDIYQFLAGEGWISGTTPARGADVIDLLERNPERFLGRKGIPFADVLEKELGGLSRAKKMPPAAVEVARRLFSAGTSRVPYRRTLGIELINGHGDGEYFRTVGSLLRTATGGGWRVAVLDDAHKMTEEAANAFLKTLEEPPPNTLLILVTSEPLQLLSTTLSRCARFAFDNVPVETLSRFLADTQGVAWDDALLLASLAEGSVRRALELRGVDFAARRRFVGELLSSVAAGDLCRTFALVGGCFGEAPAGERRREAERDEARVLLDMLALALRDVSVAPAIPPMSGLGAEVVAGFAQRRPLSEWEAMFARAELARSDVEANVEPRLAVEALFADGFAGATPR
jgi:DNA polymerase III delta prime subunit